MNFRTLALSLLLMSCAGISVATPQVSKQRLDAIWGATDDRVQTQIDTWFDNGDYPMTIHLLSFQANYSAQDENIVTNLGWMQENIQDWDGALATYKMFLANNPKSKERAYPEAEFLFRRKQFAPVPALLEPIIGLNPHPNDFRVLAHAYEKLNKLSDAKRIWDKYVALYPGDLMAKQNLKRVVKKLDAAKVKG